MRCFWSIAILLFAASAEAAIVNTAYYPFGESGSLGANNRPVDTVGGHTFSSPNSTNFSIGSGSPAPGTGSTAFLTDSAAIGGYFGVAAGSTTFPNNIDWAVDLWVQTSNTAQSADVFQGNAVNNSSIKLTLSGGNWSTSLHNIVGFGTPVAAVANTWTRLTSIRYGNSLSFYVNGVQSGGATVTANTGSNFVLGSVHLGVMSGGTNGFVGNYDEMRIWTFDSSTDSLANVQAAVFTAVPEPGTWAALSLVALTIGFASRKKSAL